MPDLAHLRPDHDETLIARLAAGDVDGREIADANALVAACPACAQLHADLRSIMAATANLPAPRRIRDFRLTDADAARPRRTGWRRLLGRFGDPRLAFTKPLATGLVTLGIAGLVLTAAPSLLTGGFGTAGAAPAQAPGAGAQDVSQATSAPAPFGPNGGVSAPPAGDNAQPSNQAFRASPPPAPAASSAAAASTIPAATAGPSTPAPVDLGVGGVTSVAGSPVPPLLESNPGVGKSTSGTTESEGPSGLALASYALVLVGIILFALRWAARRAS